MAGRMEGEEYEIKEDGTERITYTRSIETDWNGIPAYVKYVRDVTEIVQTRRDKERLDLYFRSIVEQFPGGISMMAYSPDGTMKLEFISPGFAAMMQRTVEEAKRLYDEDIFANIHPEDVKKNLRKLNKFLKSKKGSCELIARMQRKDGTYLWTSSMLSMLPSTDDILRIYIVYTDITKTVKELSLIHIYCPLPFAKDGVSWIRSPMFPPSGVYLTALESRFTSTCCRRPLSVTTCSWRTRLAFTCSV